MKNSLYLIFLFISYIYCCTTKLNDDIESWARRLENDQDSANDIIVRPCNISDMECIRNFFSANARCELVSGPVPDPLIIESNTLPLAASNITVTLTNFQVKGLNGTITSFYINQRTNNLVIALEIRPLTIISPRIIIRYNRVGREPIILEDALYVSFSSVILTAVIPNIIDLQLGQANVYAYVGDSNPVIGLGPGLMKSYDPVVLRSFNHLLRNIPANIKEGLIFQGPLFLNAFIQSNICNFGVKLEISV